MSTPIQMPALSPTMKEGKITKWLKKEGDKISSGEAVAEVETDKSNLEVEAYEDGYLLKIVVGENESVPVGAPIGYLGEKGEKVEAPVPPPKAAPAPAAQAPQPPKPLAAAAKPPPPAASMPRPQVGSAQVVPIRREEEPQSEEGRLRASPLAKRMAEERGLDLNAMQGSGPQGRIIKRDIEAALTHGATAPRLGPSLAVSAAVERREPQVVPLSSIRRVIAQRLSEVKPGVPHFYLTVDIEMDAAMQIREEAKALDAKISVNDIVVKAAAIALRRMPKMNVSLQGEQLLQYANVDIGIAVAIEEGLITPIIRDADQKGLSAIAAEARDLAERARRKALKPREYNGGSLTISNLGMFGVDSFVAVINPPQASIVAIGQVADKAVVRGSQVVVRKMMSATLSGDHRVIDGALGAEYLRELRGLLEHPMRLMF